MKKAFLRLFIIIISALSAAVLLYGCESPENSGGAGGDNNPVRDDLTPRIIAEAVLEEVEIPSAAEKHIADMEYFISGLNTGGISELAYYICASGAYPDELLIIKFNSAEEAEDAKSAVQSRLDGRKEDFRDYAPAEMYKFDDAAVRISGNWLCFYITQNNARTKEIIDLYF